MDILQYSTLDDLIGIYDERLNQESKNRGRIKKFYHDDESFDNLMNRLIQKDYIRFQKFIANVVDKRGKHYPTPWKTVFTLLDIVQNEGEEAPAYDTLTRSFPSRTIMYHGWTFSWVHGKGTLISIFNRENELVYRF